ncbi:hypothetical protein NXC14_PB00274 (plasmid) [Rhizobium sp. NXC14]|nr:hypothetical protein NXC14_PB00274 [Rhizobium sp. NXC14]
MKCTRPARYRLPAERPRMSRESLNRFEIRQGAKLLGFAELFVAVNRSRARGQACPT